MTSFAPKIRVEVYVPIRQDSAYEVTLSWIIEEFTQLRGGCTVNENVGGFYLSRGNEVVDDRVSMSWRLGKYDDTKTAITELGQYLNELSDDNQYKKIWKAWSHLYMAQMFLSQRNLNDARSQSSLALEAAAADDQETRIEINAVQCLIEVAAGAASKGRPLCEAAAKVKLEPTSLSHKGHVQLALAEARLEAGDTKGCADVILQAQQISARLHEGEREWRAWLLAARANQRLGNLDAMRQQLSSAQSLLNALREKWGDEAFSGYMSRPDIQAAQQQLQSMLTTLGR